MSQRILRFNRLLQLECEDLVLSLLLADLQATPRLLQTRGSVQPPPHILPSVMSLQERPEPLPFKPRQRPTDTLFALSCQPSQRLKVILEVGEQERKSWSVATRFDALRLPPPHLIERR